VFEGNGQKPESAKARRKSGMISHLLITGNWEVGKKGPFWLEKNRVRRGASGKEKSDNRGGVKPREAWGGRLLKNTGGEGGGLAFRKRGDNRERS